MALSCNHCCSGKATMHYMFVVELYITVKHKKFECCTTMFFKICRQQRKNTYVCLRGPGSVVGIETDYGLDGPGIESRWEARFSAPVQTGPGAHPAFCTMDTGSFPGVKSGRGVTLTSLPF